MKLLTKQTTKNDKSVFELAEQLKQVTINTSGKLSFCWILLFLESLFFENR